PGRFGGRGFLLPHGNKERPRLIHLSTGLSTGCGYSLCCIGCMETKHRPAPTVMSPKNDSHYRKAAARLRLLPLRIILIKRAGRPVSRGTVDENHSHVGTIGGVTHVTLDLCCTGPECGPHRLD